MPALLRSRFSDRYERLAQAPHTAMGGKSYKGKGGRAGRQPRGQGAPGRGQQVALWQGEPSPVRVRHRQPFLRKRKIGCGAPGVAQPGGPPELRDIRGLQPHGCGTQRSRRHRGDDGGLRGQVPAGPPENPTTSWTRTVGRADECRKCPRPSRRRLRPEQALGKNRQAHDVPARGRQHLGGILRQ